jgi:hypothetical protein
MVGRWLVASALLIAADAAVADIIVWRDANGVRHFTNRADTVPAEHRVAAEVLIVDAPRIDVPVAAVAAAAAPPVGPTVASDQERFDHAYRAGLDAGLSLVAGGGGGGAAEGGAVQINGPLAVTTVHERQDVGWGPYAWGGGWPGYYPFVTTGFDRGRSRHQTLRMLLQDQFQIDRDGPYAYDRWDEPGLGPALAPFLPRGLPVSVRQYGRVIYR